MKLQFEGSKLFYRLLIIFITILIIGIISISTMNKSGTQVAHNMEMLVDEQLPKLDTIHSLQSLLKKLELALYRYYETTDSEAFIATKDFCHREIDQLLTELDGPFVSLFQQHLDDFGLVLNSFDNEMRQPATDWNELRTQLAESRKISLEFEALLDNKESNINSSFTRYRTDTENVISDMISTQTRFSLFTFVVILMIAFLLRRQLKQHQIQKQLARYPERNPYPILRLHQSGEALYLNPAAKELAKSLNIENDPIKLIPEEYFDSASTQVANQREIFPLGDRMFNAHIHHTENADTFYAYLIDVTEQISAEKELIRRSTHDLLTGLPNRRLLESDLQQKTSGTLKPFALILLKMSRLELINSSLGHQMSDLILIEAAEKLSASITNNDGDNITLYAFEPGSWVVIFESRELSFDKSKQLADKLLDLFSHPLAINEYSFTMAGHIGMTQYPQDGTTYKELLRNADAALRKSIREGKPLQAYSEDLTKQATHWLELEQGMKEALKNDDFSLNIQPKVLAENGEFSGGEVLLRWHKNGQWISPAQFIPIAEESGLILAIGEWVLKTACQQWVKWNKQGLKPNKLAVNVSAQQFIQDNFVELVATTLKSTNMPANELELEITEEVAGQEPQKIIATMQALKEIGVQLAIDDFGTGYSSLSYLTRFPVDTLKIDRAFVSEMDTDENNYAVVRMIMSLAKELNLKVVAEGVENQQQQQMLVELGCDLIQGYYFHKPMNINDYQNLLIDSRPLFN